MIPRALLQRAHAEGWKPHKNWEGITNAQFDWTSNLAHREFGKPLQENNLAAFNLAEALLWVKSKRYGHAYQGDSNTPVSPLATVPIADGGELANNVTPGTELLW